MTFWGSRRVLVTGHTGFKGSWLCEVLLSRGAEVSGIALPPETTPALFDQLGLAARMGHGIGDIRDAGALGSMVKSAQPDIIFHLAAQPLVRRSYREPVETWSTNVMGTVHVLEAVRSLDAPCTVVVITTDKVYENSEWEHPYRENDALGGHDPYSASKAGTELVVASWRRSFLSESGIRISTARAGNVIGGGDWAEDRLIPDLARAFTDGRTLEVRNRSSIRPWQHVLDSIHGYLLLAEAMATSDSRVFEDSFNFGPEATDQRSVGELLEEARLHWGGELVDRSDPSAPHEAGKLVLSIERARSVLGWQPSWGFQRAVRETVHWYREVAEGGDPAALVRKQVADFGSQR